jgi:KDO2-lipid IV(A) lauroyltransferase
LAQARLEAAIPRLRPDLAPRALRDAAVAQWWRNTVQTLAEFAQVERLLDADRFEMIDREHLDAACRSGRPVIAVSVHLASWEASLRMLARHGLCTPKDWFTVWMPQPNRFENEIVWRIRRRHGTYAFPPAPQTSRRMLGLLRSGTANLAILVDEPAEGDVRFPLFGRALPRRCNLRLVIALARHTDALIVPGYMQRRGPARFAFHWLPQTDVADFPANETGVQAVAARLSAQFEPVVVANLEHWYMLHVLKLRDLPDTLPVVTSTGHDEAAW